MADFEIAGGVSHSQVQLAPEKDKDEGLTSADMSDMLYEIRNQPNWRHTADKESDYYDGNQLDLDTINQLEERNQAPLITNLIKPTIDTVLGMEAKTRTDWTVKAGDLAEDMTEEVAKALSVRLHKAEVESRADRACSDAYASQAKVGIGWVEVARETDPFKPKTRVKAVHRREIWWDWRAKEPDLSDARYMIRRQWLDVDVAKTAFPQSAETISHLMGGGVGINDLLINGDQGLARAIDTFRGSSIEQYEYMNAARKRVCIYEVWYKKMTSGHVMRLPNGRVVEFDLNDPKHCEVALGGMLDVMPATYMRMRRAYFIGPLKLFEGPTPYRHHEYPYVPFFGFREDRTGSPYGLIRSMLSPQDEVNSRKSKMHWLLGARRVIADSDAVIDHDAVAQEVARPDAYIILNKARDPNSQFKVEDGGQLANQQFQIMQDAKQEINQAAGVYQSMMGQAGGGVTAASAINSLVEQGTTTLGDLNDNYRYSRRKVGELLLEMVKEDLEGKQINVTIEEGSGEKIIQLNVPGMDMAGQPCVLNDVSKANVVVGLDDISSSPTFRMQQFTALTELTKSLPPQAQAVIVPYIMEESEYSKRKEIAKILRKTMGLSDDAPDPQVQQLTMQLQQMQQLMQQAQQEAQAQQQQLVQAQMALKDKSGELQLKQQELAIKQQEVQARINQPQGDDGMQAAIDAKLEMEKMTIQRESHATELRSKEIEREIELASHASAERIRMMEMEMAKLQQQLADEQRNESKPEKEAEDEGAEAANIVAKVTESIAPALKALMDEIIQLKATAEKDAKDDAAEKKDEAKDGRSIFYKAVKDADGNLLGIENGYK